MMILKDCPISELCADEIIGYGAEEFRQYNRLFLSSLEDIASRIYDRTEGSLGVFVYDTLPSIPLFIILRNTPKTLEIYNSFYLSEPVGRMPYLHWQGELKHGPEYSFESANWNMPDLFAEYFQRRWCKERKKLFLAEKENLSYEDFLYAPSSAKQKCTELVNGQTNTEDHDMPY
jgi:hypothetical protein